MSDRYPLHLDLRGRAVLVVGAGRVGARRALSLADAGALVHVVAPQVDPALADDTRVEVSRRTYVSADLDNAWLVHTATGTPVDEQVAADAEERRIWCVRADDHELSRAWTPALARHDDLTISVTAGGDPGAAIALRDAISRALRSGLLPARRKRPSGGHVALVGGGPGDPGLVTARGLDLLARADVVVADRLAPRALLDTLPVGVEVIEAGKSSEAHTLTQDEINARLVDLAGEGKRVVRLKGGDPYVFGRGSEEALACLAAGIPVEVVPGVTSAVGVPSLAGFPLTHRGVARQFTVVSAHDAALDWKSLGSLEGTLVLLMAAGRLALIGTNLVAAGRDPATPVALIRSGSLSEEEVTIGTLADLVSGALAAQPPVVAVVGDVVRVGEQIRSGPRAHA